MLIHRTPTAAWTVSVVAASRDQPVVVLLDDVTHTEWTAHQLRELRLLDTDRLSLLHVDVRDGLPDGQHDVTAPVVQVWSDGVLTAEYDRRHVDVAAQISALLDVPLSERPETPDRIGRLLGETVWSLERAAEHAAELSTELHDDVLALRERASNALEQWRGLRDRETTTLADDDDGDDD